MRRVFPLCVILIILVLLSASVSAAENDYLVEFFYGTGCPHCAKVEPFIENIQERYPEVEFQSHETWFNEDNARHLLDRFDEYDVPPSDQGVPIVFVGDTPIMDHLEELLSSPNTFTIDDATANTQADESLSMPNTLTFGAVIGAAFVDSINPCAIAVLVILLTALRGTGSARRALRGGLAFAFSIYLSYFLFGIGLSYTLHLIGASHWLYYAIGILAILIGLANLKDAFWYGGGGFVMEIPQRWRPRLQSLLKGATSPIGAFVLGFLVTLFELPCTGRPYLFVIGLLSHGTAMSVIISILLFYNVIFVLPLVVLTVLIARGMSSTERIADWKDRHIRALHLTGGAIMLVLGIWVILE